MSLRRGLMWFVGLTIFVGILVIHYTSDSETWRLLMQARYLGVALALILAALGWVFDALRIQVIAEIMEERVPFKTALSLVFLNAFGSAITPFQSGGGPILIYVLRNNGVPIGKGLALALTRTVVTVVVLGVFVPLSLLFVPDVFKESVAMMGVFLYATIFALLFGILVIVSIVKSDLIKHLVKVVTLRMDRLDVFNLRVFSIVRFFNKQIDLYAQNMKLLFTGGIFRFALLVFLTLAYLFSAIFVLPVLAWALGIGISIKKAILIQGLFFFVLYFVPTPGASGIAEGGGAAIYRVLVPLNIVGVLSIGWRFFTHYLSIFIGTIVAFETIGMEIISAILERKKQ